MYGSTIAILKRAWIFGGKLLELYQRVAIMHANTRSFENIAMVYFIATYIDQAFPRVNILFRVDHDDLAWSIDGNQAIAPVS